MRRFTVPDDDRFFCDLTRPRKCRHDTLDDAWRAAFWFFARTGRILTPYGCSYQPRAYVARYVQAVQGNPWRWSPVTVHRIVLFRATRKARPCFGWHLTRSTRHLLMR